VAKTLGQEGELVESRDGVNEDFVCLCAIDEEAARGANMNGQDLVGINDFSYWVGSVAVPEIDWCALPASHQFEFVVSALSHAEKSAILCLMASISFFKFKIIGRYRPVHGTRMYHIGLVNIWEEAYNVLLLICMNIYVS
jgi:hypothetical protein